MLKATQNARRLRREAMSRMHGDPNFPGSLLQILNPGNIGEPYETHATVARCIEIRATAFARVPMDLMTGSDEDAEKITEGPWYDLFLRPNPQMSRRTWLEAVAFYYLLDGECAIILEGEGDKLDEHAVPSEMWPISGRFLKEDIDRDTQTLKGWRIQTPTGETYYTPDRVVMYKRFNPRNPLRGLSPLQAALSAFRTDSKAARFQEDFYDNGAVPSGAIVFPATVNGRNFNPKKDQRDQLRKSWEDRHSGGGKAHRLGVLWGGVDYKQFGIPQRDMEMLQGRRWNRDEIAMVYGVHKVLLGDTDQVNRATSQEAKRILYENAVVPDTERFTDVLEADLFRVRGDQTARGRAIREGRISSVWASFDWDGVEALQEDGDIRLGKAQRAQALGFPLNEVNERYDLGFERQDWGDTGLLPFSLAPAEQVVEGSMGFGDDLLDGEPADPVGGDSGGVEPIRGRTARGSKASRDARWRAFVGGILNPGERVLRKRMKGYMHGRRVEVLRWLGGDRSVRATDQDALEAFLADARKRWADLLRGQTRPVFERIVETSSNAVAAEIGQVAHFSMEDPRTLEFLSQKDIKVQNVNATLTNGIRREMLHGMGEGETIADLQARIRRLFNGATSRSLTIARTESAQTANGARDLVFEAEGIDQTSWLTARDTHVRQEHQRLEGEVRDRGDSFVPGISLRYPGDIKAPPGQVVNCRCMAVPE